mgnify:FL=1
MDIVVSGTQEKPRYRRGQHPNSRANLHPFEKGSAPNPNGNSGPFILPRLRRMASMTYAELMALNPEKLVLAELEARRRWLAALEPDGWRDRNALEERLDGPVQKETPPVAVAVQVIWQDGTPATR